jgi:hypothetical protein
LNNKIPELGDNALLAFIKGTLKSFKDGYLDLFEGSGLQEYYDANCN